VIATGLLRDGFFQFFGPVTPSFIRFLVFQIFVEIPLKK